MDERAVSTQQDSARLTSPIEKGTTSVVPKQVESQQFGASGGPAHNNHFFLSQSLPTSLSSQAEWGTSRTQSRDLAFCGVTDQGQQGLVSALPENSWSVSGRAFRRTLLTLNSMRLQPRSLGLPGLLECPASADPLEPSSWGEPELFMARSWSNLNKTKPDPKAAHSDAEAALQLVPYWHYVRDILMKQIQDTLNKSR